MIYGDIGTSPLYVYSSTFTADPKKDDLLGALSLIIWSLTLIVSVKYILIVLCADDAGEGGQQKKTRTSVLHANNYQEHLRFTRSYQDMRTSFKETHVRQVPSRWKES